MRSIPTLNELYTGILADLETTYNISIPFFGKNFLRAVAAVQAGKLKLFYLHVGSLQKNIFIDTADPESMGGTLERFGRVKLNRNPFSATAGQYEVQITGTIGSIIPASMTFKSNDDTLNPGKMFILDLEFELESSPTEITLRALEPGLDSKLLVGNKLTATAPIAGVNKSGTVLSEVVEPLAAENIEEYRRKAMNSYRLEAQGGAATDYRLWSADAQGVQQVYPYAKSVVQNEINLYIEATLENSIDGKGTPSALLLLAVEAVVEFSPDTTLPVYERGRRPLGVHQVHYLPVTIKNIDIIITGFVGLTDAIEALILNALTTEVNKIRPFVSAADILEERNDVLDNNKIIATILTVKPGSIFTSVTLKVDDVIMTSFEFTNGDIPYLDTVTHA